MANITKYVLCDNNCKFESLDKEEILSAIQQALEEGGVTDVNPEKPFITKIKDQNTGAALTLWVGTAAQFAALTEYETNCIYVYPDEFEEETKNKFTEIDEDIKSIEERLARAPKRVLLWKMDGGQSFGTFYESTESLANKHLLLEYSQGGVKEYAEFMIVDATTTTTFRSVTLKQVVTAPSTETNIYINEVIAAYGETLTQTTLSITAYKTTIATNGTREIEVVTRDTNKVYALYEIVY